MKEIRKHLGETYTQISHCYTLGASSQRHHGELDTSSWHIKSVSCDICVTLIMVFKHDAIYRLINAKRQVCSFQLASSPVHVLVQPLNARWRLPSITVLDWPSKAGKRQAGDRQSPGALAMYGGPPKHLVVWALGNNATGTDCNFDTYSM